MLNCSSAAREREGSNKRTIENDIENKFLIKIVPNRTALNGEPNGELSKFFDTNLLN